MRFFSNSFTQNLFDIKEKPVEQVALVSSTICFVVFMAIHSLVSYSNGVAVSKIDELACLISADTCGDVARISKDDNIAKQFIERACNGGDFGHCSNIAMKYYETDKTKAISFFKKSCNADDLFSCFYLGDIFFKGKNISKDLNKAKVLLQKSCDGGLAIGCLYLTNMFDDFSKKKELLEKTCNDNSLVETYQYDSSAQSSMLKVTGAKLSACLELGVMYTYGTNSQDLQRAKDLFKKTCSSNFYEGCSNLGNLYETGKGVSKDIEKSLNLYRKSCDHGNYSGCSRLWNLYKKDIGDSNDMRKVVEEYTRSCNSGDAKGCTFLADKYISGENIEKNISEAIKFYRKSCEAGDLEYSSGCNALGSLYEEGKKGVSKDTQKALSLYRKSCDYGNYIGCSRLWSLYKKGIGNSKDMRKVVEMNTRSCNSGNVSPSLTVFHQKRQKTEQNKNNSLINQ